MKIQNKLIFSLVFLLLASISHSIVFGGTNFGFSGYPSHSCYKPSPPYKPYSMNSQWEIDSYNREVESYNADLEIYIDCINEYVENAQNDIKRIQEAASDAIDEANGY